MAVKMKVGISLDGKDDTKAAFDSAKRGASGLAAGITALSTGYLALAQIVRELAQAFAYPITAALETEKAMFQLSNTLEILGMNTDANTKAFADYANEMQRIAGIDGEAITSLNARNVLLLKNKDNAIALTQAAIGLNKTFGTDLESANQMLIQSFNGQTKGLAKLIPEIGNLGDAALAAGEGVNKVAEITNKFIGADAETAFGKIERLQLAFGDLVEDIGLGILKGFEASGAFDSLAQSMAEASGIVEGSAATWEDIGKVIGELLVDGVKRFINIMKDMMPLIEGTIWVLRKMGNVIEVIYNDIMYLVNGFRVMATVIEAAFEASKHGITDLEGAANTFKSYSAEIEKNTKAMLKNGDASDRALERLIGIDDAEVPSSFDRVIKDIVPVRTVKNPNIKIESEEKLKAEVDLQRAIKEVTLQIQGETTNAVVAEYEQRLLKLKGQEQEAALKGINVTKIAAEQRAAIQASYYRKLSEQRLQDEVMMQNDLGNTTKAMELELKQQEAEYRKMRQQGRIDDVEQNELIAEARHELNLKLREMYLDDRIEMANAAGNTTLAIELEYDKQLEAYLEMNKDKLISDQELHEAQRELERLAEIDKRQTTGNSVADRNLTTANSLIQSMQGGVNSMIQTIGSQFGPKGAIVATVITTLNQTREEFTGMIDALIEGFRSLPQNLARSIGILIEKIPEILILGLQTAFITLGADVGFWKRVLSNLWESMKQMVRNFWDLLTGKEVTGKKAEPFKQDKVVFGPDTPGDGDDQYKIKDASLASKRKAEQSFEESFTNTVTEAGKTFIDYLKEGFKELMSSSAAQFIAALLTGGFLLLWSQAAKELATRLWEEIRTFGQKFWELGTQIATGFRDMFASFGTALAKAGEKIFGGLFKELSDTGKFSEAGRDLFDGFYNAFVSIWKSFTTAGENLFNGFYSMFKSIWESFTSAGKNMFLGLWNGIKGIWEQFTTLGSNIAAGLWNSLIDMDWGSLFNFSSGGKSILDAVGLNKGGMVTNSMVSDGNAARVLAGMGVPRYATGGIVPGAGFTDSAIGLLTPGERVLNREETKEYNAGKSGGGQTINFTFNVSAGAVLDRDAIKRAMPLIIEQFRRDTRNGTLAVNKQGVY